MPCREGPGDPEWLALTDGERAAVFVLAALLADDSLDRKLFMGTAVGYARGEVMQQSHAQQMTYCRSISLTSHVFARI